jgi:homogentisate 1,2-dioxygenase
MSYYLRVGDIPPKRHTFHHDTSGRRLFEELMGEEGFSGESCLLYHRHSPSAIVAVEGVEMDRSPLRSNHPLLPWHLRAPQLDAPPAADLVTGRQPLMGNSSLCINWVSAATSSELYRNAAGDELVYLQSGQAVMESVFGRLVVAAGDYVVVPASTTHRWVIPPGLTVEALVVEAVGHIGLPERYRSATGQLREGAPYSERDLRPPTGPLVVADADAGPVPVLVRARGGWSRHLQATHPFDVVGWDGCAYPYALSIHDFEPIAGRIHQPPPVHQTFAGNGFVVCSFVPRLFDFGDNVVKVPYHHANVDSDEVLFYSAGDFMSRKGSGIAAGSLTLHPAGFVHGPQPGSVEASIDVERTEETAVMIDTFEPLALSDAARGVADPDYPWSWARPTP